MNLRQHSVQALLRVTRDGQSLTAALDAELTKIADPQGRAFIQALCFGVCRQFQQLEFLVDQLLSQPVRNKDRDIRLLIMIGLFQLLFMRVKKHAAVSETVAGVGKKRWAKSLVNAVLRRCIREQDQLLLAVDAHVQAKYSHPQWMIDKLQAQWPEQADAALLANNQAAPMVLRVNLGQTCRVDYLAELARADIKAVAVEGLDTAIVLDQAVTVDRLPGFAVGRVSVQDSAAQLAAELLDVHPDHAVLDLCAAPGGKTMAVLERQPGLAGMLALDVSAERMQRVQENLQRAGLEAETVVADATIPMDWAKGREFDRILLDAPCSASGVIRRHPDIKILRRADDIEKLQQLQARILEVSWTVLKPGGKLLYATCSIFQEENEQQIECFLKRYMDASEIKIDADWGLPRPFGRQILTGERQMDGFYYALLHKSF